ncbi:MAG: hypothetical protein M1838_004044 [Thelocarpon superellum]|nr:MAG: hypothetical protein M1838_004044 [Thelocarpon superellum]
MAAITLPSVMTPTLLRSISKHPHLPKHTWYFIAGVALSVLNRADEIPKVLTHALDHCATPACTSGSTSASRIPPPTHEDPVRIARKMREALIKMAPIAGLPRAINALMALKAGTPAALLDLPSGDGSTSTSRSTDIYATPSSAILQRGQSFFDLVYGKVAGRVMGGMERSGTEDLGLTARLMYGYILSHTRVLSGVETSYVLIAGLIPQDVNSQLKGHLKGALNQGASVAEVRAVRDVVIRICEASGMTCWTADGSSSSPPPGGWGWRGEVANL